MIQTAIESPSFHVYGILKLVNLSVDKPPVTVKKSGASELITIFVVKWNNLVLQCSFTS